MSLAAIKRLPHLDCCAVRRFFTEDGVRGKCSPHEQYQNAPPRSAPSAKLRAAQQSKIPVQKLTSNVLNLEIILHVDLVSFEAVDGVDLSWRSLAFEPRGAAPTVMICHRH